MARDGSKRYVALDGRPTEGDAGSNREAEGKSSKQSCG
jgi:hypothetical protein